MNRRNSLKAGAMMLSVMIITPQVQSANHSISGKLDSFWDVIKNRRSVRKFKSDKVPYKDLEKIVDAARMAPTAGNQQPWKFLIIQDKNQIEKLKNEALASTETYLKGNRKLEGEELKKNLQEAEIRLTSGYLSAPAYIVVLTDQNCKYPTYTSHDGALAAGYLMLAARAIGYGTVYITDAIPESVTQKAFNIPENYKRVCITPVGVPVEWPTKEKKELESFIVKESF